VSAARRRAHSERLAEIEVELARALAKLSRLEAQQADHAAVIEGAIALVLDEPHPSRPSLRLIRDTDLTDRT
jgi:hypothetical protein